MSRTSLWWGGFGQPFAMFALLCQMVAVVLAVPNAVAMRIVSEVGVICDSGAPVQDRVPAHHRAECPVCPICVTAALVAISPAPPAPLPPPTRLGPAAPLPPARAGPALRIVRLAAQPRGPPAPA